MAYTAYISFPNVIGESIDKTGAPTIQLDSWSWGVSNSGSPTSGAGAGKASFQDFSFTANVDTHSSALFNAAADGKNFATATLTVYQDNTAILKVEFRDVLISSYKLDESGTIGIGLAGAAVTLNLAEPASTNLAKPVESVTFAFRSVVLEATTGGVTTNPTTGVNAF